MSKQVWGTCSVKDHCDPRAFISEVMLYDRLVVPIPVDDNDRIRWTVNGWDPDRLDKVLEILGKRARTIPWDAEREAKWKKRYDARADIAAGTPDWAFAATRLVLTEDLPRFVTGVQVVSNYITVPEMETEIGLRPAGDNEIPLYGGSAVAIIGHEFFVPDDPNWTYEDLLKEAVELSSDTDAELKRRAFWRWQREFFNDQGITDQSSLDEAVAEMHDLIEREKERIRKKNIVTTLRYAMLAGSVTLGAIGGPLTAVALGTAFVSIGQFVTDRFAEGGIDGVDKPVCLVNDIQKHFGWSSA